MLFYTWVEKRQEKKQLLLIINEIAGEWYIYLYILCSFNFGEMNIQMHVLQI